MREKRAFGRRPTFKPAAVVLDDGRRLPGTLLDQSEGGAKIILATPESLSGELFLEILEDDLIVRCRVAHASLGAVGLQYVKSPRRISWMKK
jgi:hypothetical protein